MDFAHSSLSSSCLTAGEVTSSESRFVHVYRARLDYDYYRNPDFVPHFEPEIPSNSTLTEEEVYQLCGEDYPCTYDYSLTVDADVARDALDIIDWYEDIREDAERGIATTFGEDLNANVSQRNGDSRGQFTVLSQKPQGVDNVRFRIFSLPSSSLLFPLIQKVTNLGSLCVTLADIVHNYNIM